MKPIRYSMILALLVSAAAHAQRPARDGDAQRPPPPPIITALDSDRDGVLSSGEIENASASLLTLDEDGDGKLSRNELASRPPAQNAEAERRPRPQRNRGASPIMQALDKDGNGSLSEEEIGNATAALLTLDKNGDAELTRDELRPGPPRERPDRGGAGGGRGPGGPGGPGGPPRGAGR